MDINASFKLFDIRGLYPQEVDERLAFAIGKSLVDLYKPFKVIIGSDTRASSPALKEALKDGLSGGLVEILDIGEVSSPQFYFTVAADDYDIGIMITASHVVHSQNGFKLAKSTGLPFSQKEISDLKREVTNHKNDPIIVPKKESKRIDTTASYVQEIIDRIPVYEFKSKVVLDMTKTPLTTAVLAAFSDLKINYKIAKSNHEGNPILPENQKDLSQMVLAEKADLGIVWDSDGDRVVFIDSNGQMIPMSFVLGLLAFDEVKNKRGGKVTCDVRAGFVVRDLVTEAGGELITLPAWSQYAKFAMQEDKTICFGGETSGHFIYQDFYKIDDGLLAGLRFLYLWDRGVAKEKLELLRKKYFELPETNFPCIEGKAPAILEGLAEFYRQKNFNVSVMDGLTVFGKDFKFNLRASMTEPLLRLNLETGSQQKAQEIVHYLEKQIDGD